MLSLSKTVHCYSLLRMLCYSHVYVSTDADLSQRLTSFLFRRDRPGGSSQTTAGHSSIRAVSPMH